MKMKNILLGIVMMLMFASATVFGQIIPNSGFENWTDSMTAPGWNSLKQNFGIIVFSSIKRTTDAHSGSFAAKFRTETIPVINQTIPGFANLGGFSLTDQEFYGGVPANGQKPTKLKGWFKYSTVGTDSVGIGVFCKKYNSLTSSSDEVGFGGIQVAGTQNGYLYFEFPIDYYTPGVMPDTVDIILSSATSETPQAGSVLFVDDLSFDFAVGIAQTDLNTTSWSVSPNPVKECMRINSSDSREFRLEIFNALGVKVMSKEKVLSGEKVNLKILDKGFYFVTLHSEGTKRTFKIVVSE